MGYKISFSYNWYITGDEKLLIKTYYINNIAFTFNDISETSQSDIIIISEANNNLIYNPEDFFLKSLYLIEEECHPCLFELDIENPELLDDLEV